MIIVWLAMYSNRKVEKREFISENETCYIDDHGGAYRKDIAWGKYFHARRDAFNSLNERINERCRMLTNQLAREEMSRVKLIEEMDDA